MASEKSEPESTTEVSGGGADRKSGPNATDDFQPLTSDDLAEWRASITQSTGWYREPHNRSGAFYRVGRLFATIDALEEERLGALDWAIRVNKERIDLETEVRRLRRD